MQDVILNEMVKKEIEKCKVRCANGHPIKTASDLGHYYKLRESENDLSLD